MGREDGDYIQRHVPHHLGLPIDAKSAAAALRAIGSCELLSRDLEMKLSMPSLLFLITIVCALFVVLSAVSCAAILSHRYHF